MSRAIGGIFLVALAAAAAVWGVWTFAIQRPDTQMQLYARSAELRNEAARPRPVDPKRLRATACAAGPCVLVEAGGQSFLVGAGEGAAEGLDVWGLLRPGLKGVLLTDLAPRTVQGLPALREATWQAGRRQPLVVFGPEGVERIVIGVNTMLEGAGAGDAAAMLSAGLDVEGGVFSGGGLSVAGMPAAEGSARIYRFEFGGESLVVAGCSATAADLAMAARGVKAAYAILPAASAKLANIETAAAKRAGRSPPSSADLGEGCASVEVAARAVAGAGLAGAMIAPLYPSPQDAAGVRAWGVAVGAAGPSLTAGASGVVFEVGGARPGTPAASAPSVAAAPAAASPSSAPLEAKPAAEPAAVAKPDPNPAPVGKATPTPAKPVVAAVPSPTPSLATKPAALTPPTASPAPVLPRPRRTPSPAATAAIVAEPTPESPPPSATPTVSPEPAPAPIFPLRDGLPRSDSPLVIGPRPSTAPSPAPTP